MKYIKLTNGGIAVIDDEDYWLVKKYKWCRQDHNCGLSYAYNTTTNKPRQMHQLIAGAHLGKLKGKKIHIHHIDGNGLNNCKNNMRYVITGEHQRAHHKCEDKNFGLKMS